MGYIERSIRRGISRAAGDVIERQIINAVAPKATAQMNENTRRMNEAAAGMRQAACNVEQSAASYKFCTSCGAGNPIASQYCQICGTALSEVRRQPPCCPGCGAQNAAGTRFCGNCGHPL